MWNDDIAAALGALCKITGSRPSDMIGWSSPDDIFDRLFFDMYIVSKIKQE